MSDIQSCSSYFKITILLAVCLSSSKCRPSGDLRLSISLPMFLMKNETGHQVPEDSIHDIRFEMAFTPQHRPTPLDELLRVLDLDNLFKNILTIFGGNLSNNENIQNNNKDGPFSAYKESEIRLGNNIRTPNNIYAPNQHSGYSNTNERSTDNLNLHINQNLESPKMLKQYELILGFNKSNYSHQNNDPFNLNKKLTDGNANANPNDVDLTNRNKEASEFSKELEPKYGSDLSNESYIDNAEHNQAQYSKKEVAEFRNNENVLVFPDQIRDRKKLHPNFEENLNKSNSIHELVSNRSFSNEINDEIFTQTFFDDGTEATTEFNTTMDYESTTPDYDYDLFNRMGAPGHVVASLLG